MYALDRRRGPQGPLERHAKQPCTLHQKKGPEALAAGEHGIAHRLLHPVLKPGGSRQQPLQRRIHSDVAILQSRGKPAEIRPQSSRPGRFMPDAFRRNIAPKRGVP